MRMPQSSIESIRDLPSLRTIRTSLLIGPGRKALGIEQSTPYAAAGT